MTENILPLPVDLEVERALRVLTRNQVARVRATSILRDELKSASSAERARLIALITLLERADVSAARH